jgi:glutathione S-transferase
MPLTLYYHPLSSFCWKVLVALYEGDVAFEPRQVNLGDPAERAAFEAIWPLAKFPVLRDEQQSKTIPESSLIIEYLARTEPAASFLVPVDPDAAMQTRLIDRLIDSYIHVPLQRVVAERMRPDGQHDPFGVQQAHDQIRSGYRVLGPMLAGPFATGREFTLADCAAVPALFYADYAVPLTDWPDLSAYLGRLKARPSVARVLAEAEPFFQYFPLKEG